MRTVLKRLTVVGATVALVAACGAGANAGGPAGYATDGTFTMALASDPGVVDPYRNVLSLGEMGSLAYDPLVNVSPDGTVVSGLAEKWQADARSASFTLKPGITCSDGSPLTASQVAKALDFVKNPKNQSPLYGLLLPTTGFTVRADDAARTLRITMTAPFGFVLETIGRTPIMCARGLAEPAHLKTASAGTGPFVLTEVVAGDHYTFSVRKGYTWGPGGASTAVAGTPAKIVVKIVPNETTAANLLLTGDVNMAMVPGADRERLAAQQLQRLELRNTLGELWFNQRDGRPGADLLVRRALTAALDLDQLAKVSTSGHGVRATGLIAKRPRPCGDDAATGVLPTHDPAQAAALLDQAGWVPAAGGIRAKAGQPLRVDLHYTAADGEGGPAAAELVAQQWKAVGVEVKLTADDLNALNRTMFQTGSFDAYWSGFKFSMPHQVIPFVTGGVPPAGQNFAAVENADYQRLTSQAARTAGDPGCALWNSAEQALLRNVDVVPVSDTTVPYFLRKAEARTEGWLQVPIPTSIRVLR